MSICRFDILVTIDANNGISKQGAHPWRYQSISKHFRDITVGKGRNAVIMGRTTYELMPNGPLPDRHNVVISRRLSQQEHPEISIYPSMVDALYGLGNRMHKNAYDRVVVIGGEHIFEEVLRKYLYLCDRIFVTKLKTEYGCDQHFNWDIVKNFRLLREPCKTKEFVRYEFSPDFSHPEDQYIKLLCDTSDFGETTIHNDLPVHTISKPSTLTFNQVDNMIPVFTTNYIDIEKTVRKLIFMVSGKTDSKILEDQDVTDYKSVTSTECLKAKGIEWDEGDLGPYEGFQWRHFGQGSEYDGMTETYVGHDQLQTLIDGLKNTPRTDHILMSYDPLSLHKLSDRTQSQTFIQFFVSANRKYLDCNLTKSSCDLLLLPNEILLYYLLYVMVAHVSCYTPRTFNFTINQTYMNSNHMDVLRKIAQRTPKPMPYYHIRNGGKIHDIDSFNKENIVVSEYNSWQYLGPTRS